ncbi:S8 family peptidase [Streptomyces bambusae]|uniref:S8 family peptidase n=1 Tax=Streptomyces bambusae TaxID=1550616 RepID=UPI001D0002C1|nr:S8 family peptidase [Streptomyces bambusae]MCB5170375.1 S8 family peptidase [Streptomyces bambusae]
MPGRGFRGRPATAVALGAAMLLAVGTAATATAAPAPQPEGVIANEGAAGTVPGSYIVILNPARADSLSADGRSVVARYDGRIRHTYSAALNGYAADLTARQARRLAADPAVAQVVQNSTVHADTTQPTPPSWGLDRIDRRRKPGQDKKYTYPTSAGTGVTAYILDTGINFTHRDFGGRARSGYDAVAPGTPAWDENGHGTHVAGTVAGTTFGVAKKSKLVAVRVLDANGSGTIAGVVAGVDWVTRNAVKPAVANMSLGGGANAALDTAVRNSIAKGITYAVAAGNENKDALTRSPARVSTAITVGSTQSDDRRSSFSNWGKGVDLFAPGSDITSAVWWDDSSSTTLSGTSMATPHVAGAAALYLSTHRTATPAAVDKAIKANATTDGVWDRGTGSPNRLLYVGTAKQKPVGPRFTNTANYAFSGGSAAHSPVTVTGLTGRAPSNLEVLLSVRNPAWGFPRADLIAPDGTVYSLKLTDTRWDMPDLGGVWSVNASAELAKGKWRLRVKEDPAAGLTGYIDSWTLRF